MNKISILTIGCALSLALASAGGCIGPKEETVKETPMPTPPIETEIEGYTPYVSEDELIPKFSFQYPENWEFDVLPSADYDRGLMIYIGGPFSQEKTRRASLAIYVRPDKRYRGEFETLDEYAEDTIANNSYGPTEILLDEESMLGGEPGREVSLSCQRHAPLRSPQAKEITVVTRMMLTKKDAFFFEINYQAPEEIYSKYLEAYEQVVATFSFQ